MSQSRTKAYVISQKRLQWIETDSEDMTMALCFLHSPAYYCDNIFQNNGEVCYGLAGLVDN